MCLQFTCGNGAGTEKNLYGDGDKSCGDGVEMGMRSPGMGGMGEGYRYTFIICIHFINLWLLLAMHAIYQYLASRRQPI